MAASPNYGPVNDSPLLNGSRFTDELLPMMELLIIGWLVGPISIFNTQFIEHKGIL